MKIGIDAGLTGAVAIFDEHGGFCHLFDMPVIANGKGKAKVKQQVNAAMLRSLLAAYPIEAIDMAYIEEVSAMPGQGVSSVFSFGHTMGTIQAVLACLKIPSMLIRPAAWKKSFGLLHADKDAARTLAVRFYPAASAFLGLKKHHNRADAMLIARYGWSH